MSIFARQPVKSLFIIFFVLTTCVRIPYLVLHHMPKSLRPRPTWSYWQALSNDLTKLFFIFASSIQLKTPREIEGGAEADVFSLVQAAPDQIYRYPLTEHSIEPTSVGGIWVPERYRYSPHDRARVILHFHGGAYVLLSPRLPTAQYGPKMLCRELPAAAAFCPQYRLASNPGGVFPAALQDAVTAYRYLLVDQRIEASRIVLSGDSSGAHLVIGLLRYLTENKDLLPLPAAALLHSPWVDLTENGTRLKENRNAESDYLCTQLLQWGSKAFVPPGEKADGKYFSPLGHPFALKVPIWIQVGTAEVFYDKVIHWAEQMSQIADNQVQLHTVKDGMHDVFAVGGDFGMDDQALTAIQAARMFVGGVTCSMQSLE